MTKPLVIFGTGDIAQLAFTYFEADSDYDVVAFTVDSEYLESSEFCGRPVVDFESVAERFPPENHRLFIALSYANVNALRKSKFEAGRAMGYQFASYVSSRASILNEGQIGENCFILEDNTIQPFVCIGDNVTLWSGNHVGHHSTIGDHCFIASHVVISGGVMIGSQCFIGVNSTLRDHIVIGERCVIGAGALMLSDAEPEGVYVAKGTERSRVPSSRLRKI
ncbi:acetyltransferase [Henriciella sp.]|uniref:acetyltransferase n=1 Tax=Henriciella sp. TaxID=1968823 RepID=UPI0026188570|nr:acetyltransferase [Henriciella sp.]